MQVGELVPSKSRKGGMCPLLPLCLLLLLLLLLFLLLL